MRFTLLVDCLQINAKKNTIPNLIYNSSDLFLSNCMINEIIEVKTLDELTLLKFFNFLTSMIIKTIVVFIFEIGAFSMIKSQVSITSNSQKEAVCVVCSNLLNRDAEANEINKLVIYLVTKDFKVHKFYTEKNSCEVIKNNTKNFSVFIYLGHEIFLGINGGFDGKLIGEFTSAKRITINQQIRTKK